MVNKYIKIQFRHTVGLIKLWRVCKSATVCDYLPHSHDNRSLLVRDITGSLRVRPERAASAQPRAKRSVALGLIRVEDCALKGQKRKTQIVMENMYMIVNAFALSGRRYHDFLKPRAPLRFALGCALAAPSGRTHKRHILIQF